MLARGLGSTDFIPRLAVASRAEQLLLESRFECVDSFGCRLGSNEESGRPGKGAFNNGELDDIVRISAQMRKMMDENEAGDSWADDNGGVSSSSSPSASSSASPFEGLRSSPSSSPLDVMVAEADRAITFLDVVTGMHALVLCMSSSYTTNISFKAASGPPASPSADLPWDDPGLNWYRTLLDRAIEAGHCRHIVLIVTGAGTEEPLESARSHHVVRHLMQAASSSGGAVSYTVMYTGAVTEKGGGKQAIQVSRPPVSLSSPLFSPSTSPSTSAYSSSSSSSLSSSCHSSSSSSALPGISLEDLAEVGLLALLTSNTVNKAFAIRGVDVGNRLGRTGTVAASATGATKTGGSGGAQFPSLRTRLAALEREDASIERKIDRELEGSRQRNRTTGEDGEDERGVGEAPFNGDLYALMETLE